MPTDDKLRGLPDPVQLHEAFSRQHSVAWGQVLPSTAQLSAQYGANATANSLTALRATIQAEPSITAEFLAALPASGQAYGLDSRVKSPASLARKFRDNQEKAHPGPPDDVLRYTALAKSPDHLVTVATQTIEALQRSGWQVRQATQSYTEGSRYKGLHAELRAPGGQPVEVQFHSPESAHVKESTTRWYEVERSADVDPVERAAARARCTELSATLELPKGLDQLSRLGGVEVAVTNYSDSRTADQQAARPAAPQAAQPAAPERAAQRPPGERTRPGPTITTDDGIKR